MQTTPHLLARLLTRAMMICATLATLGLTACEDDDDDAPAPQSNIVQLAQATPSLSTLVAAVQKADLATTLSGTTELTVFAPTNDAFAQLPAPFNNAQNITAITDQAQIATLRGILLYHVTAGDLDASELRAQAYTTQRPASAAGVNDNQIFVSKPAAGGVFVNGNTRVTQPDVDASNGMVHVIDRVLLPPTQTIAQIVTASTTGATPQFTQLLRALGRQNTDVQALLTAASTSTSNLTIFAPTDAAFQALLTQRGLTNIDQVPDATLVSILRLHVVNNTRAFSSDLTNGQTIPTFNGNVTIGVSGNAVTVRGNGNTVNGVTTPANVATANILANNGVIHVIDRVLLP